jgi:hypothetical protein
MLLQWGFGAVIVVLYARDRFDKPDSVRFTTTRTRYWAARVGYILSMLLLFLMLGGTVADLDLRWLWDFLQVQSVVKNSERLPGPLLSALVLTSMLPHVEFLSRVDEAVKKWFQRIGNIPFEVRLLSAQLQAREFRPEPSVLDRVTPKLLEMGVDPTWLDEPADSVRRRWARTATLWALLDNWKSTRGYSSYLTQQKDRYDDIQSRFETVSGLLEDARFWAADQPSDGHARSALRKTVRKDVDLLHRSVCDFLSGGVLDREWNVSQRNSVLADLGFRDLPGSNGGMTIHEVFLVTGLIFLAMTLIALISRRFIDPSPLAPNMRILVMVPIIYAVAIVVAIYPKAIWRFADIRLTGHRPVAAYAMSGAVAAAAAFMISMLFRFLFEGDGNLLLALSEQGRFERAIAVTMERWPWQLMTMMTTFSIAWAADNYLTQDAPRWLRIGETLGLAACFLVFQWIAIELLAAFTTDGVKWFARAPRLLLTSTAVGACIGYFVPHLYRTKLKAAERATPQLASVPAA